MWVFTKYGFFERRCVHGRGTESMANQSIRTTS